MPLRLPPIIRRLWYFLPMAQLISFGTSLFDPGNERPNPINPIAGKSILIRLRTSLRMKMDPRNSSAITKCKPMIYLLLRYSVH